MATTKQAEQEKTEKLLADEYLNDLVYDALLERGEAAKISEITLEIDNPRILYPVVRRILNESPRFLIVDRQWDLTARYLDRSHTTERNLVEVIDAAGKPLSAITLATELSTVYSRDSSDYFALIKRAGRNEYTYFATAMGDYGLAKWLPLTDAEEEEDVLFDNHLTLEALAPFAEISEKANWSPERYATATLTIVEQAKYPLSHRLLGVLAWFALRGKYDPLAHINACLADTRLVWLSGKNGGRWITRAFADRLELLLEEEGVAAGANASEEAEEAVASVPVVSPVSPPEPVTLVSTTPVDVVLVEESLVEVAEEVVTESVTEPIPVPVPEVAPLNIADEDLKAIEQIVADRGVAVEATELLALRFEIVPGDPSFRADLNVLQAQLQSDERFLYVGAGRFREPNSLPLFVYELPEFLSFPDLQFVSMDGEIMDEEIEDEGLAGALRQELLNPLAQDAGDDESRYTGDASADAERIRLVVKAHHKEFGTFPLCQIPDGYFPKDADVAEIAIRDPSGQTHDVIINNNIRLGFNLFGLYEYLQADSGGAFYLSKGKRPFEFTFEPAEENDVQVYLTPERMEELLALREQAEESGDVATFDIACEILAHYPKGLDFVQAMTEVNVVRRVTRRKLASILSNYHCFMQKPGQNLWRFDAKKRDLGTDRSMRKYIKR